MKYQVRRPGPNHGRAFWRARVRLGADGDAPVHDRGTISVEKLPEYLLSDFQGAGLAQDSAGDLGVRGGPGFSG